MLQTGFEFRVLRLLRNSRTGLFLGPKVEEYLADDFALVDPLDTVGINLSKGLGNGFIRRGEAQRFEGIDQPGMIVSGPGFGDRLLRLPLFPGLSVGPHPVEKDWPAQSDTRRSNFNHLLLQFQVENRTLARAMSLWFWKNTRLYQGMES